MSDLQDLRALLTRWDVPFDETATINHNTIPGPSPREVVQEPVTIIEINNDGYEYSRSERPVPQSPRVEGYGSFFTIFNFTPDGEFLRVGIWE